METKKCGRCGKVKPVGEFYRNRTVKDGLTWQCKECRAEMFKEAKKRQREAPRLLRSMRAALKTKDKEGGPIAVQTYRQLLRENPERFMSKLEKMEAAHQAAKGKVASPGGHVSVLVKDEGTERCLELVDEWLKRHEMESAPVGAPPHAL